VQSNEETGEGRAYLGPQHGNLELPSGDRPQTIYVKAFDQIPAFALQSSGPFFTGGFSWQYDSHPLFVTFELSSGIAGIVSRGKQLHCSATHERKQHLCIPASRAQYEFDVEFTSGCLHDPVIVVTPIND
jgi:hypothetical protein